MQTENPTKPKELKDVIIDITAGFYNMQPEMLRENTGRFIDAEMAYRKHICYFMLREYTFMSYNTIGKLFSTRHSTIQCGVNKINDLRTYNRRIIVEIKNIKKLIDSFKEKSEHQALAN